MDSTLGSAVIGGAITLATFTLGGAATSWRARTADRDAAKKEGRAAAESLIAAVLDIQAAIAVADSRRRDWGTMYSVAARSIAQFIASHESGRSADGAARALGSAMEWRHGVDGADEMRAAAAIARLSGAAAKTAMLDSPELRTATSEMLDAVVALMATADRRPSSAVRREASERVGIAVGSIGDAARAYDGRDRPVWWRRVARVPRRRPAGE